MRGGKCGSTFIDRNLHLLMRKRFGKAFEEIEMRRKGPGSRFMNEWERVKRSFGAKGDDQVKEIGPLNLKGVKSSQYFDDEDGMVRLTRYGMDDKDVRRVVGGEVEHLLTLSGTMLRASSNLSSPTSYGSYRIRKERSRSRGISSMSAYCSDSFRETC